MRSLTFTPLLYAATTLAANPRLVARQDDVCLHQEDFRENVIKGDSAKARDFWNGMGATQIISDYLNSHGVRNWANDFLGSNYDCGSFPASSNCRSPDVGSCPRYDPKPKYYIQIAMSNLNNAFIRWHEALQDSAIKEITSGIPEITGDWGPPKADSNDIVGMVLGASMSVTGFTDEAVKLPIEASMSIFESAISAAKTAAEQDPDELEGDLVTALGKCFDLMKSQLDTTVRSTFRADSPLDLVTSIVNPLVGIALPALDPRAKIIGFMNDGVFLDSDIVNRAMDAWIESMTSLIHDGLVVKAWQTTNSEFGYKNIVLKKEKWNGDHNEDWCRSLPLYNIEEDGCNGFATFHSYDTLTSEVVYKFWDADQVAKAVKSIRDPGYALKNAVDCKNAGGGDASYPAPNFGALTPEYPPCFFNIQSE